MIRTQDQTRELLRRYDAALAAQLWLVDLGLVSKRFRTNHGISADDPIIPELGKVYEAHVARVEGKSSPAEAEKVAREIAA